MFKELLEQAFMLFKIFQKRKYFFHKKEIMFDYGMEFKTEWFAAANESMKKASYA